MSALPGPTRPVPEFAGRFIGCVLVPDALKNNIEDKGDFTMRLKPLSLPGKIGIWHVVLNSRFVFGVSNPHSLIKAPPLVRIRLPLLIDIQAWFAAQSARPGHIAV